MVSSIASSSAVVKPDQASTGSSMKGKSPRWVCVECDVSVEEIFAADAGGRLISSDRSLDSMGSGSDTLAEAMDLSFCRTLGKIEAPGSCSGLVGRFCRL
jgi:hypothetical protein